MTRTVIKPGEEPPGYMWWKNVYVRVEPDSAIPRYRDPPEKRIAFELRGHKEPMEVLRAGPYMRDGCIMPLMCQGDEAKFAEWFVGLYVKRPPPGWVTLADRIIDDRVGGGWLEVDVDGLAEVLQRYAADIARVHRTAPRWEDWQKAEGGDAVEPGGA